MQIPFQQVRLNLPGVGDDDGDAALGGIASKCLLGSDSISGHPQPLLLPTTLTSDPPQPPLTPTISPDTPPSVY